jgi:hypothetical protein
MNSRAASSATPWNRIFVTSRRRGVVDYRVICDDSNNTDAVIEQNRFVGDIYVKPARSINFVQLNFVAVRPASVPRSNGRRSVRARSS